MKIRRFEIHHAEIPFRTVFSHAKSRRRTSCSIFVRCELEDGTAGFGESLPRPYVTGETAESAFELLQKSVLPAVIDREFGSFEQVGEFCAHLQNYLRAQELDLPEHPGAACCAAELALLDAFGRHFDRALLPAEGENPSYSGVISAGSPPAVAALALKYRRAGIKSIKLKVGDRWEAANARLCRWILGKDASLRVDANGGWDLNRALAAVPKLQALGIDYFEQPLAANDHAHMRHLQEVTGCRIIVDESLRDERDAQTLIENRACRAFNIRLSKVGGYYPALRIAKMARAAGLDVQIGCQVGETALLSMAALAAARQMGHLLFAEGFFGNYLLQRDITADARAGAAGYRFGAGGQVPKLKPGLGWGIEIDAAYLDKCTVRKAAVGPVRCD